MEQKFRDRSGSISWPLDSGVMRAQGQQGDRGRQDHNAYLQGGWEKGVGRVNMFILYISLLFEFYNEHFRALLLESRFL